MGNEKRFLLIVYGTRPEYIKIQPVIEELKRKGVFYKVLYTGQHCSEKEKPWDFRLRIEDAPNRLDAIISSICGKDTQNVLSGAAAVLVQGDTATAFATALAAFHRDIKVIHLEAGLRTWDINNPRPEESYRKMIGALAELHLCPTETAAENLWLEQVSGAIRITGNTVLDTLPDPGNLEYGKKILVTMHRRENIPDIVEWFNAIDSLAEEYNEYSWVFPVHPNPKIRKHLGLLRNVNTIDPLSREDIIEMLRVCRIVITDSGGLQEEASWFRKRCVVCRKATEREETLGISSILAKTPDDLREVFRSEISKDNPEDICPFGDGKAAKKVVEYVLKEGWR